MTRRWDLERADALAQSIAERRWDDARGIARELAAIRGADDAGPYRGRPADDDAELSRVLACIDACERKAWQEAYFSLTDGGLVDPAMESLSKLEALVLAALGIHAMSAGERVIAASAIGGDVADSVCLDLKIEVFALSDAVSEVALEHYRERVRRSPDDAQAWQMIAQHALRLGDERAAATAAERALAVAPHLLASHLVLADVAESRDDAEAALEHLERASTTCEDSCMLWSRLGEMKETLFGDPSEALACFERALALDGDDIVANEGRRRILEALGDDEALIEQLSDMIARGIGSQDDLRAALIAARERVGDGEGAALERERFQQEDEDAERQHLERLERGLELADDGPDFARAMIGTVLLVALIFVLYLMKS